MQLLERTIPLAILIGRSVVVVATLAPVAWGQRVLLNETFDNVPPGLDLLVPEELALVSADTFNRSIISAEDPAGAFITGGDFEDPFDPGNNQSLLLYNPNNNAQEAINWFSIFPDDANDPFYFLRNGSIEFDVYLEAALPNSHWTYLGIRFGFERNPADRNQVSTPGDQTVFNSFRMQEGGLAEGGVNLLFDQGNIDSFSNSDVVVADRAMRVRYELDGDTSTFKVLIDNLEDPDDPVELVWPGSGTSEQPWVEHFDFSTFMNEPAPGVNEITFITDASAAGVGSTEVANVYIDNLIVIDDDQPPDPMGDPDYNNDGLVNAADYTVWRDTLGDMVDPAGSGADGDGDGMITAADRDVWVAGYGSIVVGGASGATVPEPSTWMLLAVGLLGVGAGMRRRTN